MTVKTTYELDGSVTNQMVCGNPSCGRVLLEWEGTENEPGPEDHDYMLFRIESRAFFVNRYGQPLNTVPAGQPCQALGVDMLLNLRGQLVGYRITSGSRMFLEDFCSDHCATKFLDAKPEYGLCVRREPGQPEGMGAFVADAPDRFRTAQVQVSLP